MGSYDFLRVFDGDSVRAPMLHEFSGHIIDQPAAKTVVIATSGMMHVSFVSDGSVTAAGFRAAYSFSLRRRMLEDEPEDDVLSMTMPAAISLAAVLTFIIAVGVSTFIYVTASPCLAPNVLLPLTALRYYIVLSAWPKALSVC